jgi:hypothetical protein
MFVQYDDRPIPPQRRYRWTIVEDQPGPLDLSPDQRDPRGSGRGSQQFGRQCQAYIADVMFDTKVTLGIERAGQPYHVYELVGYPRRGKP